MAHGVCTGASVCAGVCFDSKPPDYSHSHAVVCTTEQSQSVFLDEDKPGNILQSCVSCAPTFNGDSNEKAV